MKTTLKSVLLLLLTLTFLNCDNDDDNAANVDVCNYEGLTAEINGTITLIPENELYTHYFPNNDGPGAPAVEVGYTTNLGNTFVVTRALTVGAIDTNPEIRIDDVDYAGVVTCQRANSAVGEELRFDVVLTGVGEAELCVVIDEVTP